jgi:hydroxyacylglutathione hydrolase
MSRVAAIALVVATSCGAPSSDPTGTTGNAETSAGETKADMPSTSGDPSMTTTGPSTDPTTSTSLTTDPDTSGTSTTSSESSSTGEIEPCSGAFPPAWPDGLDCGAPEIFVHQYDANTFILRQSLCTSFEGPFLYLLFGEDRVLLEDTGAGGVDVVGTVGDVITQWLADNGKASIELVVVNSHAHGDHTAGNAMFGELPGVTVVQPSVGALSDFFGITEWPEQIVQYDLGGRVLDVIPIPGHHVSHIALFDHGTGWLLTGDTLYPGRLYIDDFDAYVASISRLVDNTAADEVCNVMGTHIEMTNTPGVDYPFGADEHPDEHVLQLDYAHLVELRDAVQAMDIPEIEVHDDFIVYPL